MNANLVRAPGFEFHVEQRKSIEALAHTIQRERTASAAHDSHTRPVRAIASGTGYYSGYGFAIPIGLAKTVMNDLIEHGEVRRAIVGVSLLEVDPEDAEAAGLKEIRGAKVADFTDKDSPALKAGLEPGDIITAVDGKPVQRVGAREDCRHHIARVLLAGYAVEFGAQRVALAGGGSGAVVRGAGGVSGGRVGDAGAALGAAGVRLGPPGVPLVHQPSVLVAPERRDAEDAAGRPHPAFPESLPRVHADELARLVSEEGARRTLEHGCTSRRVGAEERTRQNELRDPTGMPCRESSREVAAHRVDGYPHSGIQMAVRVRCPTLRRPGVPAAAGSSRSADRRGETPSARDTAGRGRWWSP